MKKKPYILFIRKAGGDWGFSDVASFYWVVNSRRGNKLIIDGPDLYDSLNKAKRAVERLPMDFTKIDIEYDV